MVGDDRGDVTPGRWEGFLGVATVCCLGPYLLWRLAVGGWLAAWIVARGMGGRGYGLHSVAVDVSG